MGIYAKYRPFGGGSGSGSGNAEVGALLRQSGETALGLYISSGEADVSWHLRGVERQLEEAAVPAEIVWTNQDEDATVTLKAPVDWVAPPETVNGAVVRHTRYTAPRDAIPATYAVGGVRVASQQDGSEGNNDLATIVAGSAAHSKRNAQATLDGDRGPSTDRTHLFVRSPDFGSPQTATAQLLRSGPIYIKVDWNAAGVAGNGFRVRVEREGAVPAGQAAATVDRDGSSNVIGITVGVNGTVTFAAIAAAFNGVSVAGTQLVTATEIGGQSASRAFIDTSLDDSANLAGGTAQGYRASGTIAGSVVVHYYTVGAVGNGFEVLIDRASTTAGQVNVQYVRKDNGRITASLLPLSNLGGIRLVVNGTITRAQLAAALNSVVTDGVQVVTATAGAGAISYTNSAADEDIELSGGTTGTGAGTNFGEVTVTRAPDSDPPTAATATIDAADTSTAAPRATVNLAPTGDTAVNITIIGTLPGGTGNGWNGGTVSVAKRGTAGLDVDVFIRSDSRANPRIEIDILGTHTVQSIVDDLNNNNSFGDQSFTVDLGSTDGATTVTWDSSDTAGPATSFSAGSPSGDRLTGAGITVTHSTPGVVGNNSTVRVTKGTPVQPLNAFAGIVSTQAFGPLNVRSPTTGDRSGAGTNTGSIRVLTGQLHTDPVGATADINVAGPGDTPVVIRVTLTGDSRGTAANSKSIQINYDSLGGSDPDLAVNGDSPSNGNVEIALRGTVTIANILTALSGNLPLDGGGNSSVHVSSQVIANSGSAINVTWGSSDTGREVNFAGGLDGAQGAKATINVAPSGDTAANLDFTATTIGTGGNGTRLGVGSKSSAGVALDWDAEQTEVIISLNGTWTLTQLIAAINAASQNHIPEARRFTASLPSGGSGSTSITWASSDSDGAGSSDTFAGGQAAERDPLSAAWDATANRLTITARAGDLFSAVRQVIRDLPEFKIGSARNNSDPGSIWYAVGAGGNNTIVVDSTVGNHIDYNFAGGSDTGIARTALAADWTSPLLEITGVVPTDTVQNVIDIINALSSAPTAAVSGASVDAANDTIYLPTGNTQSQDYNFTGGAAGGGHTVRAVYTEATNTLAITALPTDTYDSVMNAIAALSDFQRTRGGNVVDGSMPGDVWRSNNSTTLDIIDTPASTSAAALSYDFENGRDAATRSPLTVVGSVDSVPAAATLGFISGVVLTYYKTGTEGTGARARAQMRYNPDIASTRASATANISGVNVRFRWHNSDTYGNGVTVQLRRHSSGISSQWNSGTKVYTVNLGDGTYTYRQLQNNFARAFHAIPPIDRTLGPIRMEVAAGDLDSEFTVDGTWTTIGTAAFAGAGASGNRVLAEYVSSRELVVTHETNSAAALNTPFPSQSDVVSAINGARWEGLQLIVATIDGSGAGPITRWPNDPPQAGDTVPVGLGTYTLAGGAEGASLITITGIIAADTAQNLHDAYTGPSDLFTIPTGSTAVGSVTAATRALFSGGRDPLGRQLPTVQLFDDGDIGVSAILHEDEAANTTLQELTQALWTTTYTNTDGNTVPLPFDSVIIDTSGGGAVGDPMRFQNRPTQPSGGENFVPEGDIEALVRPDDEVQGPNVEVRYHADHDTLQEIIDALIEQGEVDVTDTYGTNLDAVPEEPPFIRGMYPGGGDTTINVTGGSAVSIQDEGADLGEAQTMNFTGAGVTVTGTGNTKRVSVPGVSPSDTRAQVASEVKDFAQTGGPQPGSDDIAQEMTRDTEVPGLFADALTDGTPSDAFNDEIPFLTSGGNWRKANSEAWRQQLSVDLGEWADTAGFFVFRVGDYTTSHGQLYRVNAQNTKNLSNGPETNNAYTLVGLFGGNWTDRYWKEGSIVRDNGALWQANADIAQGSGRPGSNTSWLRISEDPATVVRVAAKSGSPLTFTCTRADGDTYDVQVDGAADSLVSVALTATTLTVHKRDGSSVVHTFTAGSSGTTVVANPTGSGGDTLTRLSVAGTDYTVPQTEADTYKIIWEENAPGIYRNTTVSDGSNNLGRQWSQGNGALGIVNPVPFDAEVAEMSLILVQKLGRPVDANNSTNGSRTEILETTVGIEIVDPDAAVTSGATEANAAPTGTIPDGLQVTLPAAASWIHYGTTVPEAESPISIPEGSLVRPVTIEPTGTGKAAALTGNAGADCIGLVGLLLRRVGTAHGAPTRVRPHISSFALQAGNISPVAGSIAGNTYAFTYAISQGSHAGSARVIGFKGDTQPTDSVEVLATLSNLNHGGGTVTIPADTTLAADEKYRLRMQVFDEGVTNPGAATATASYQDIVITAHAAATAAYQVTYVAYDSNDADAAATAARITDLTNVTATSTQLPTEITVALPDASEYQIALLAKSDEAQPSGFTSGGQNASGSFYDAEDLTLSSIMFKAYILKPLFRLTNANNGETFGVTP